MSINEPTDEVQVQNYVSRLYQRRYSGTGFLYHARVVTQMLKEVKFRDGRFSDRILDVGCGIGFLSQLYPNFDIVGIDVSGGMLSRNPYRYLHASAENIPFKDNTFDFVVCRSLLHHLDHPQLGLMEMGRVLKPGGKWICWEPNYTGFNEFIRGIARKTKRFRHWHLNFKSEELRRLIESAGLKITQMTYQGFFAYPLLGFPDIMKLPISISFGRGLMRIDDLLSRSPLKKLGWAVLVRADK